MKSLPTLSVFLPPTLQGMQFPATFEVHVLRATSGNNYPSEMASTLSSGEGLAVVQHHRHRDNAILRGPRSESLLSEASVFSLVYSQKASLQGIIYINCIKIQHTCILHTCICNRQVYVVHTYLYITYLYNITTYLWELKMHSYQNYQPYSLWNL